MPAWLVLLFLMVLLLLAIQPATDDFTWSRRLRRPDWVAGFHVWIPILWLVIQIGFFLSAVLSWEVTRNPALLVAYGVLVVLVQGYTWLMCRTRRLGVGAFACLGAWLFGAGLSLFVRSSSLPAALLLLPFLLWAPVEARLTWQMLRLNR